LFDIFKKRGCPGWGANPGPLDFIYFLIFHHFTAEPQRLPWLFDICKLQLSKVSKDWTILKNYLFPRCKWFSLLTRRTLRWCISIVKKCEVFH
jgi:hypothetical protein